jgi:hypothetical protein
MPLLKDNRYRDLECVIHFGDNKKQVMREFQDKRIKLAARFIQKQDIAALRQIDLREYQKVS